MAHAETETRSLGLFGDLPLSSTVRVEFGARCVAGRHHPINGDHHVIVRLGRSQESLITSLPEDVIGGRFDEYRYGMIVADGIGTATQSEVAARTAITTLLRLIVYFGKWSLRIDDDEVEHEIRTRADRFFRHVDLAMTQHAVVTGPTAKLQTSMTTTFGAGDHLFYAHVGHCRAYLFRDGMLTCLTRDHTVGSRRSNTPGRPHLVDVVPLSRDLTHILEQTIGMSGSQGPRVDVGTFRLENADLILLCTNGVTDHLDDVAIADVLVHEESPDEYCHALVDIATERGGDDDATALVARYRIPPPG